VAKDKEKKSPKSKDSGKKYYCGECGSEVEDGHENCTVCHSKIDWDKIKIGLIKWG
jgi:hypothetical protein